MSLKKKIEQDYKKALKGEKRIEVSTLKLLKMAIFNKEKEKRFKLSKKKPELKEKELEKESCLTENEILDVISSEIKKRKEAIFEFEKNEKVKTLLSPSRKKRLLELIEKEKTEMKVLKRYLPSQLSKEEIKKIAQEVIKKVGAQEPRDIGKVMAELMPKVKGRANGHLVSEIVKELLENRL